MSEDEIQYLRERPDMCAAFAIESLVGSVLDDSSYQIPKWVLQSRVREVEAHHEDDEPNDEEEFVWLSSTLKKLGGNFENPYDLI